MSVQVDVSDEILEKVTTITQKYLENMPVIILGSGASIPYNLPSMSDLSEEIIHKLEKEFIGDIQWKEFKNAIKKLNNLELALQEVRLNREITKKIIITTWKYINNKDLDVFNKLHEKPNMLHLTKLFKKLLEAHPRKISVITTNYDRLVEYAADLANSYVTTGFLGTYMKNFRPLEAPYNKRAKWVNIYKVHGSLDWFKNNNGHIFSCPLQQNIPQKSFPLIVTPGTTKYQETHNEPYRSIISQADDIISNASSFLCVGYGFNDEHIQPKLIRQIQRNNKPIVVITKTLSSKGQAILNNELANRFIVFEEYEGEQTKVTAKEFNYKIDGNFWNLGNFIKIWMG